MQNKDEKLSFRLSGNLKEKILNHSLQKEMSISKFLEQVLEDYFKPQFNDKEEEMVTTEEISSPEEESLKPTIWSWVLSLSIISFFTLFLVKFSKKKGF
ncbi:hypothetical protein [Lacihabitans soyangensis]|nr:hypothetical protein [Lacihabitans soyangensis]